MARSAESTVRADPDEFTRGLGLVSWLRSTRSFDATLPYLACQAHDPAPEDVVALTHFAAHQLMLSSGEFVD